MRAAAKRRAALVDLAAGAGFENSFVRDLPADPVLLNVPRQVSNACYTRIEPTPVAAPKLLAWSDALGELLGLSRPGAQAVEALLGIDLERKVARDLVTSTMDTRPGKDTSPATAPSTGTRRTCRSTRMRS